MHILDLMERIVNLLKCIKMSCLRRALEISSLCSDNSQDFAYKPFFLFAHHRLSSIKPRLFIPNEIQSAKAKGILRYSVSVSFSFLHLKFAFVYKNISLAPVSVILNLLNFQYLEYIYLSLESYEFVKLLDHSTSEVKHILT